MAQGDVTVTIIDSDDTSSIDTWVTNARQTANDKWLMCSAANGLQVVLVHIEEA